MPKTILADTRRQPRFAGVSTFCRYPLLDLVPAESRPIDWAVYGVPYDSGVTYRPGARFGPRAIRDASQYVKRYSMHHGVDVCETLSLADAGDAPVSPYSPKDTLDGVAAFARGLGEDSTRLLAVGGDHSVAYANIRACWEKQGRPEGGLCLLHFDSHVDTVDEVWGQKWGHASPFIRAIEDGLVNPSRMISVGIKGPLNTPDDLDYAKSHGVTMLTRDEYLAETGAETLRDFVHRQGEHPAYVSFDIDVVDPAYAPGTGTPSVGGLTSAEALDAVRNLAGANVVGGDVVEVLPDRDPAGITALLAAHIMFEIICLDAARRAGG